MTKQLQILPLALLLLLQSGLRAETLEGRIFLGPGLGLFLEKDEGLFREMLRALSLVSGDAPVVDLTALEISRSHLILDQEGSVYVRDQDDEELHEVGTWTGPGEVRLEPGVVLEVTRTNAEIFEGEDDRGLVVHVESDAGVDPSEVEVADFTFWMDQLGDIFLPGAMSRDEEADAALLIQALLGALPTDPSPTAEQAENLKQLRNWVQDHRFGNLEAVVPLVQGALSRVRGEGVFEHDDLDSYEHEALRDLERYYLEIREAARE